MSQDGDVVEAPGHWRALAVLASAMVLAMTTWFSATAVLPQLRAQWHLTSQGSSWLTISVGRGTALGVMVGALTLGSAVPHLANGIAGFDADFVLLLTSGLPVVGGVLGDRVGSDGPYPFPSAAFAPGQTLRILRNRPFLLASVGLRPHVGAVRDVGMDLGVSPR